MDKATFIKNELAKVPQVDFSDARQAKILCPFHDDHNPSLDVLLQKKVMRDGKVIGVGTYSCWSCRAHGGWNTLAKKLKLAEWTEEKKAEYADQPDNPFDEFSRDLEAQNKAKTDYVKPVTDGPWQGDWRGLKGSFLRSIGAEAFWDKEYDEYRIYLPVFDAFNNPVGHVLARGEGSKIPDKKKYLNSKGFDGRQYWYGLHLEKEPKCVVIVEGPFDMLRFRANGIPAIANLGVQLRKDTENTVPDEKIMQILAKGCTKVILALDGDRAGREAVPGFTASFMKWGFGVFDLNLCDYVPQGVKTDPGDCPEQVMVDLKNFIETIGK